MDANGHPWVSLYRLYTEQLNNYCKKLIIAKRCASIIGLTQDHVRYDFAHIGIKSRNDALPALVLYEHLLV